MNVDLGASNLGKQLCVIWDVLKSHWDVLTSHWDMLASHWDVLYPTGTCVSPIGTYAHPSGMQACPTGMCICPNGISLGATGGVYLFNRTHFCQMTTCICFSPLFRCCFEIVVHLSRIVLYIIGFFTLNVCHRYLPFRVHPQIIKINYMSSGLHVTALWDLSCPTGTLGHERLSQDPTGKWVLRPNFS